MVNDKLVLQINKLNVSPDKNRLKYNQAERGKIVDVIVVDNDGVTPYDLTGKDLIFNDTKAVGNDVKMIIDSGGGTHSGKFITTADDLKQGKFSYQFCEYAFEQSGECQFEFEADSKHIDVSSPFYIDITATGDLKPANTSYVSDMEAFKASYNTLLANFKNASDAQLKSLTDAIKSAIDNSNDQVKAQLAPLLKQVQDATNQVADYQSKLSTLQTQWNNELKTISGKATNDTTAAVNSINQKYADDFAKLKANFTSWQTTFEKTTTDDVNNILAQVKQNGTDISAVQKQVTDTLQKMDTLKQSFDKYDFTKFVTNDQIANYYTKDQVDAKLADAGKVKTASINGGTKITPDDSGNLALTVPNPDLSNYPTKTDLQNDLSTKADKTDLASKADDSAVVKGVTVNGGAEIKPTNGVVNITTPNPDLSGYETKDDATTALNGKADKTDLSNYTKTSDLGTWFTNNEMVHVDTEADADAYRKAHPNIPFIFWGK